MKLLAVDTTLGACSVAVRDGATRLAHRFEAMERGHAEALAPMVQETMVAAGISYTDLGRLGVTTGPGTFTGQRVGVAFMRGLRIALQRPLIGVTSLSAMAHQAMDETGCEIAVAIHDARRDEVYFEASGKGIAESSPQILKFDAALSAIEALMRTGSLALAGTASARVQEAGATIRLGTKRAAIVAPDADWVARLCASAPPSAEVPRPLYLRDADAKLPRAQS
jgi:tRNA threonylcarbamoyladenosine biosynthesis protein TsaB